MADLLDFIQLYFDMIIGNVFIVYTNTMATTE